MNQKIEYILDVFDTSVTRGERSYAEDKKIAIETIKYLLEKEYDRGYDDGLEEA